MTSVWTVLIMWRSLWQLRMSLVLRWVTRNQCSWSGSVKRYSQNMWKRQFFYYYYKCSFCNSSFDLSKVVSRLSFSFNKNSKYFINYASKQGCIHLRIKDPGGTIFDEMGKGNTEHEINFFPSDVPPPQKKIR